MPRTMPAFASRPLEPVTTTLAIAESRMSCTFGSGGIKLFKKRNIRCSFVGSVPKRPTRCQRKSDPGASANRSRYAICAASPVVLSVVVSQTSRRRTRQMNARYFIFGRVYFAQRKYPLKSECVREQSSVRFCAPSSFAAPDDSMNKRILILTAGFGEGHNSAARGVRDGLASVAPNQADVELRDLFAEAYGPVNEFVRRGYLALVNSAPRAWGTV